MIANDVDVVVLGGGPAGINAAVTAAAHGLSVVLIDQNPAGGGQVYRPTPVQFTADANKPDSTTVQGDALREKLRASRVACYFGHTVWGISHDFRIDAIGPDGPVHWTCKAVITAAGTTERVVPFPGWTLPGVIGLAAATIMLKSQKMLPGATTLVAGCGPLLTAVAAGIIDGGGKVVAVADAAPRSAWIKSTPQLLSRPDLMWQGVKWLTQIKRAGVPLMSAHAIASVKLQDGKLHASLAPVDAERRLIAGGQTIIVVTDAVVVGNGLVPGTDVTRALRAEHTFSGPSGGWIPTLTDYCRSSVPFLYAAGDGCGIAGAAAAEHHGELAGLTIAHDLGQLGKSAFEALAEPVRQRLDKASTFGRSMGRLMALPPKQVESIAAQTVVCRCEDVTRQEIDAAVEHGARDMNQVKAWTRCGMGPCQGRTCGDIAASLVALKVGSREHAGQFTGRAPLRPVSLEELTGTYEYSDIPLPKAAPL